ncbi:MAG: T9SS type A sorting domain-containing protein, partial [Saprospiraceae bacterium]|nr:T9SS type A sorting domain-containing protein [Saprospiraceae bacterium]
VDGDLEGTGCIGDFWVVKLDYDGNMLWQKCYGGSGLDFPNSMSLYHNQSVFIAGYTDSDDGDVTGYHDSYDYWVISIDLEGNLLWQKALGGSSWDQAFDIYWEWVFGYIWVIGESLSEDGDITTNHGTTDYWMVALDITGKVLFEKSFGGSGEESGKSILLDYEGGIYVFGSASSTDGQVEDNHGNSDIWIVNTDYNGNYQWSKCIGGTRFEQPLSSTFSFPDISSAPDGIVLAGHTNSKDGDIEGYKGSDDVWIVKLSDASTSTNNPHMENGAASLYPNPARDFVTISSGLDHVRIDQVGIYDVIGRTMVKVPVDAFSLTMNIKENLALSGVYFVEVMLSTGDRIVKRMIVE